MLATLDVDKTWKAATDVERRVLIDEFIEEITVLPDYLDVKVHGAPALHVLYQEVGMKDRVLIVSEGGLEPPRPCGHQPLKLARLPIPPLRRACHWTAAFGDRSAWPWALPRARVTAGRTRGGPIRPWRAPTDPAATVSCCWWIPVS